MDDEGIRQIGKNLWSVRVKRVEKATGRVRNRKATVRGSKADARAERDRLRAELAATQQQRPRTQLRAFALSWLERKQDDPDMKATTVRKYTYSLQHILPVLGDRYLDAISPADVESYVAARVREAGLKGGNTVLNELRCLRTIARDAVRNGYSDRYWCDGVRPPKVREYTRERPNLLTADQFRALLFAVPPQWRGLLLFIATTGLRWGEASALHWEDVHDGEAVIRWNNDRGRLTTVKTKGSNRVVPALPEIVALWGARRAAGPVFTSRYGKLHRGYPLRKVLDEACAAAGVTRITPHGLRRTFNNLARPTSSREVLKAITGHATDAMVEHYSLVGADEKAAVSRSVAALIGVPEVSRSGDVN